MKKLLFFIMMILLITAGCSSSTNSDGTSETDQTKKSNEPNTASEVNESLDTDESTEEMNKEDLTLQVLKVDKDAGATIENNPIYSALQKMIDENPKLGKDDDFSVQTVNIYHTGEESVLVLVCINRLDSSIKNISFDLTIGEKGGDYIWKDFNVNLPEDEAGILPSNSAAPFIMKLSKEKEKQLKSLDEESLKLEINNFKFE